MDWELCLSGVIVGAAFGSLLFGLFVLHLANSGVDYE